MSRRKDARGEVLNRGDRRFEQHTHYNDKGSQLCKNYGIDNKFSTSVGDVTCSHCKRELRKFLTRRT